LRITATCDREATWQRQHRSSTRGGQARTMGYRLGNGLP